MNISDCDPIFIRAPVAVDCRRQQNFSLRIMTLGKQKGRRDAAPLSCLRLVRPGDQPVDQPLAGVFFLKAPRILSHSSILTPWRRMIAACWSTERVLFQAQ